MNLLQRPLPIRHFTAGDLFSGLGRHAEDEQRQTGHHEAGHDEVEDVVEFAALDTNDERYVDVTLRTTLVLDLVPLRRHTCSGDNRHTMYVHTTGFSLSKPI